MSGFTSSGQALDKAENYDYDACDQLTCFDGVGFEYDLNGNLAKKRDDMAGDMVYKFNYANRLREVLFADGTKAQYAYKSDGMRISQTDRTGKTTKYYWDSSNIPKALNEGDEEGNITLNLFPGTGFKSTKNGSQNSTQWRWFITDHLGSVIALTDNNGITTDEYTYDEYGTITQTKGSSYNPCKYIGQQYDEETGLIYLRARYYDSQTGRFLSRDPIGIRGGQQEFLYCANNPISKVDLSGLLSIYVLPFTTWNQSQYNDLLWLLKKLNHKPDIKLSSVRQGKQISAKDVACAYKNNDILIIIGHAKEGGVFGHQDFILNPKDVGEHLKKISGPYKNRLTMFLGCDTDLYKSIWINQLGINAGSQGVIANSKIFLLPNAPTFLTFFFDNCLNQRRLSYRDSLDCAVKLMNKGGADNLTYWGV